MALEKFCFHSSVIALTGGMGSGKSSVASWLRDNSGFFYINADKVVAGLLEIGADGWRQLRRVLGAGFFAGQGALDKLLLRKAIFQDAGLRIAVERVIHPLVLQGIRLEVARKEGSKHRCLVEVPLLYEAGWQRYFTHVIVVYASDDICAGRVQKRDVVALEDARVAISAQMPLVEKVRMSDYCIDNSGSWVETVRQLNKLQKELDTLGTMA